MELSIVCAIISHMFLLATLFNLLYRRSEIQFAYLEDKLTSIISKLEVMECVPRKLTTQEVEKLFNQLLEDQKNLPK